MIRRINENENYYPKLDFMRISKRIYGYDDNIEVYTQSEFYGSYHSKLLKSVDDVERFNFHSDHWGSEEDYEEQAIEVMSRIENYIGEKVRIYFDEDEQPIATLLGMRIDKQYNSHIAIIVDDFIDD